MAVTYRCPECRKRFRWLLENEPLPDDCPLCGAHIGCDRPDDDVVAPYIHLKSGALASADSVYREMEAASERRVDAAAQMAGCDASEMSALKITDLNDRRDAPVGAVALPDNDVSRVMSQGVGGFGNSDGVGYSGAVAAGPFPNAGARMQSIVRQEHTQKFQGTVTSEMPALEVQNPTYRRRV